MADLRVIHGQDEPAQAESVASILRHLSSRKLTSLVVLYGHEEDDKVEQEYCYAFPKEKNLAATLGMLEVVKADLIHNATFNTHDLEEE